MKSMQKPKIGISLRVVEAPSYDEKRDALSHDWPKLLEKLGFNPIYIPNTLSHVDEFFSEIYNHYENLSHILEIFYFSDHY